jgi:hypothetical protein
MLPEEIDWSGLALLSVLREIGRASDIGNLRHESIEGRHCRMVRQMEETCKDASRYGVKVLFEVPPARITNPLTAEGLPRYSLIPDANKPIETESFLRRRRSDAKVGRRGNLRLQPLQFQIQWRVKRCQGKEDA